MGYIPIYLSARAHYFKSIEHDFSIEFILNLHLPILEMRIWILRAATLFWTLRCILHLLLDQVSFLIPAKVSGQQIPEGFLKETRVIVVIGAKGFLLC